MTSALPSTFESEREFVNSSFKPPDPGDSLLVRTTEIRNSDGSANHMVSGVRLVIGPNDDDQGLYQRFNVDRSNTTEPGAPTKRNHLTLCADQVIIRGEFSLPDTDLSIYARELVFEDSAGVPSRINTSPLRYTQTKARDCDPSTKPPTAGRNGENGLPAGNIDLRIGRLRVPQEVQPTARFILSGGDGQDAGHGKDGKNGDPLRSTSTFRWNVKGFCGTSHFDLQFDVPAVFIDKEVRWGLSRVGGSPWGTNAWPTSGEDALSPGKPGEGGDGGAFSCNLDVARYVENYGGRAGAKAPNVQGGCAGTPKKSAHWKAEAWDNLIHYPGDLSYSKTETRETHDGVSYDAQAALQPAGKTPEKVCKFDESAWLHPFQLLAVMSYVRESYLSGARDTIRDLLLEYRKALLAAPTNSTGPEALFDPVQLQSFGAEVITLLRRLEGGLDYFGHRAGWTPLLSLPASLRLYEREVGWALRALMLAELVNDKSREHTNAATALSHAVDQLAQDSSKAAEAVESGEAILRSLPAKMESIEKDLFSLNVELSALHEKLLAEAKNDASKKAMINMATQTFSAICSVIPYGQPALSAVGSMATIVAKWDPENPCDTFGGLAEVFSGVAESKLNDAAASIIEESKEKTRKKDNDPEKEKKRKGDKAELAAAKEKADRLTHVGKNLGPALGKVNDAVRGLSVPQSEIDAELARLAAKRPEFDTLATKIRALNVRKAAFAAQLDEASAIVGDAYSRIASNFSSRRVLENQRSVTLGLLNHAAQLYVKELGSRAKARLIEYLYYLVKSWESTMLEGCTDIDYQMVDVFEGIANLLKGEGASAELTPENLEKFAHALKPLFDENRKRIEGKLLGGFRMEFENVISCRLSEEQTPEIIKALNETGEALIDVKALGLVPADRERVRIGNIAIKRLELKNVPTHMNGSAELAIEPTQDGTIRSGGKLYAVRSGNDQNGGAGGPRQLWGATFEIARPAELKRIQPSSETAELLKVLLGETDHELKEKLIKPPLWTTLKVHYRNHSSQIRPELVWVDLELTLNYAPLEDDCIVVLDVSAVGVTSRQREVPLCPPISCTPVDSNQHGGGIGKLYRLFGRSETVTLEAEPTFGLWEFSHWEVLNTNTAKALEVEPMGNRVVLRMEANLRAVACYVSQPHGTLGVRGESLENIIALPHANFVMLAATPVPESTRSFPELSGALFNDYSAQDDHPIGYVRPGVSLSVLEGPVDSAGQTWWRVDHHGLVGWLRESGSAIAP